MLWNWTIIDACFLSTQWHIRSHGAFAGTCIAVVAMVVLLEALRRAGREYDEWILAEFRRRVISESTSSTPTKTTTTVMCSNKGTAVMSADSDAEGPEAMGRRFRPGLGQQLVRAVLHAATFGLAYLLMLMAMYYNGYIIICIFIGAGLGKFLFDWGPGPVVTVGGGKSGGRAIDEATVCCG